MFEQAVQIDNENRHSTSLLRIGTENLGSKKPIFVQENYTEEIYENIKIGQSILTVKAYNFQDSNIEYKILGEDKFLIDKNS